MTRVGICNEERRCWDVKMCVLTVKCSVHFHDYKTVLAVTISPSAHESISPSPSVHSIRQSPSTHIHGNGIHIHISHSHRLPIHSQKFISPLQFISSYFQIAAFALFCSYSYFAQRTLLHVLFHNQYIQYSPVPCNAYNAC